MILPEEPAENCQTYAFWTKNPEPKGQMWPQMIFFKAAVESDYFGWQKVDQLVDPIKQLTFGELAD